MATVINFKRSSTQNAVPTTSDLSLGEVAINTYHGRMYTEKNDGSAAITEIGSNPKTLSVNDAYSFPTSDGTSGQVLQTIGSTTTVISGNDDNNNSLLYTAGTEQVYLNGVKLIDGSVDYAATNSSTITLQANALSGDVLEVVAITEAANLVQGYYTASVLTATTADQVLSSNAVAIKGIKYVINATHATAGTHACEVLLINNGSNAYFVQYGDVYSTASLFTLSADIDSGNMRLLVTPANTNTTIDTFQIRHS